MITNIEDFQFFNLTKEGYDTLVNAKDDNEQLWKSIQDENIIMIPFSKEDLKYEILFEFLFLFIQ